MNPDATRLPTFYEAGMFYVAKVGLGSDQTWLQCEGAVIAFTQDMPLYPWNLSTTFHPVPCNTPECPQGHCNDGGQCIYIAAYASGSATSGDLAKETFTLDSNTGAVENMDLHVGCGLRQDNFDRLFGDNHSRGKPNMIAGMLGLGKGPWSFLNQLGAAGQGKFSYCFETFNQNIKASNTYLRFCEDATIGAAARNVHATPIAVREQFRTTYYYLNLKDVSVGDKTVGFPKDTFKLNDQGEGGALIDSGARLSFM
ncbi:aspartic proteinase nepenthesin-2-like [Papaver somniferum]|uniref:aspartic proteinase nepenthesin-2-like n=1 Tax=Papaver somniferum TaxID=3469 RepID=UPI000E701C95|nr:aspartic proteinase nepenthesin-2-like [Papaver somniferum]